MKLLRRVVEMIIYFGEMFLAPLLAVVLFFTSTRGTVDFAILAAAGIVAWTLAEYAFHRFVLHYLAPTQHRIHHAKPGEPVLTVFWQIWICFVVVYLIAGNIAAKSRRFCLSASTQVSIFPNR